ncbi:MAG: OmpA family protein [Bacteroidetes bacterium]|nr:OmpA family protein [Bacteroidota bacterium]
MHHLKLSSLVFLFLLTTCCPSLSGQNLKYVRVVERSSGLPLDSFKVDFYQDTMGHLALVSSGLSDKHGLVRAPSAAHAFNKIYAHEVNNDTLIHYWPAVEKTRQFKADTATVKVDKVHRKRFMAPVIYFGKDSADIGGYYEKHDLAKAVKMLKERPDIGYVIYGNTDEHPEHPNARALSLRRAENVKKWLLKNGMDEKRLRIVADGDNNIQVPCMAEQNCDEADAQNRRVDIVSTPLENLNAIPR